MSLTGKPPMGLKQPKAKRDPAYLAAVARLPCCICQAFGEMQLSRTTVHHTIMGRYGTNRTPDRQTIPLCRGHHQGDYDTSKVAIHREPKKWADLYGRDTEWIEATQDAVAGE